MQSEHIIANPWLVPYDYVSNIEVEPSRGRADEHTWSPERLEMMCSQTGCEVM
jgi:hypothetical protein